MDPFIPSQQPRSAYKFISDLDAVDCSICTEPFGTHHPPVIVPGCRHIFGLECLAEWVFSTNLSHNRCPICRRLMFDNGVSEADGGIYNQAIYPALGEPPVYILNRSYIEGLWTGRRQPFGVLPGTWVGFHIPDMPSAPRSLPEALGMEIGAIGRLHEAQRQLESAQHERQRELRAYFGRLEQSPSIQQLQDSSRFTESPHWMQPRPPSTDLSNVPAFRMSPFPHNQASLSRLEHMLGLNHDLSVQVRTLARTSHTAGPRRHTHSSIWPSPSPRFYRMMRHSDQNVSTGGMITRLGNGLDTVIEDVSAKNLDNEADVVDEEGHAEDDTDVSEKHGEADDEN